MACGTGKGKIDSIDALTREHDAGIALDSGTRPIDGEWRSSLFGPDWLPMDEGGMADSENRFLHDFSYAGYHRGEIKPPYGQGAVVVTVDQNLGDGRTDATSSVQTAIDQACKLGGGVVRVPAGTYRVRLPEATSRAALALTCSWVILRGDGSATTRILFDDAERARSKFILSVRAPSGSIWSGSENHVLPSDVTHPTRRIELASTAGLTVGDWVAVRNDVTPAFRAEHRMNMATTGAAADWWPSDSFLGLVYPRRIVRIEDNAVYLDAPTRYTLKVRDQARLYRINGLIEEAGIEGLSFGMVQNTKSPVTPENDHDLDYDLVGTTGYEVHASAAIELDRIHDSWIYDVTSFVPEPNLHSGVHLLSNGIKIQPGAFRITVETCRLGQPQYRGGGGNGYLYQIQGHDNLLVNVRSENARHGFIVNGSASGNVFLRAHTVASRMSDDSHRYLAQANLYDGVKLESAWLQAVNRGETSTGGGFTATMTVFWNTHVIKNHPSAKGCAVETSQWAWGYAIGSHAKAGQQGKLCKVSFSNSTWSKLDPGNPVDFVEGEHQGATLFPQSLYEAQLELRCARQKIACQASAVNSTEINNN
jgi:hypothetical protein